MRTTIASLILLALAMLTACGHPANTKIDTATPEALSRSLADARSGLPPERQADFDQAVSYLGSPKIGELFVAPEVVRAGFMATINGLTADGVIEAARQDRITRAIRMNEALIPANLQSGFLLAEQTFRKGGYNDQDKDGVGEYATIGQLCGAEPTLGTKDGYVSKPGQIQLIQPELGAGELSGYRYAVYLPAGSAAATTISGSERVDDRERFFVCYAWPVKPLESGAHLYAITQAGNLFWRPSVAGEGAPMWNELFTVKTGSAEAVFTSPGWSPCPTTAH